MSAQLVLADRNDPKTIARGATFTRIAAVILLTLPVLFATLTVQLHPDFELQMRSFALPVRAAEAAIVLVAMRDGFSLFGSIRRLDLVTKAAAAVWFCSVVIAALFARHAQATATVLAAGTLLHGVTVLALFDRLRVYRSGPTLMLAGAWGLVGYAIVAVTCAVVLSYQVEFPWLYFGVGVSNVRQIAFYGLPVLGIALGLLASERRSPPLGQLAILVSAGIFLVCWSGGRAAICAALITFGTALFLAHPVRRVRTVAISALATTAVLPLVQAFSFSPLWGLASLQRFVSQTGSIDQYSSSRIQFWKWTWQDIALQPWIGHGEGQFGPMIAARTGVFYNHPHNVVLQMMYEWGVPGFCAVAVLAGRVLWRMRGHGLEHVRQNAPAVCGLVGLVTMAMLEGTLYHALPILFALLFLAVIASREPMPNRRSLGTIQ